MGEKDEGIKKLPEIEQFRTIVLRNCSKNSHRDIKYIIGNIITNIFITMYVSDGY